MPGFSLSRFSFSSAAEIAWRISASCVRRWADSAANLRRTISSVDDALSVEVVEDDEEEAGEDRRLINVGENYKSRGQLSTRLLKRVGVWMDAPRRKSTAPGQQR